MDAMHAIVELMGHNIAGRISEENVAGVPMLRVDMPELPGEPAYTQYFAGNAIYAITPTDEGTSTRAAQRLHIQPAPTSSPRPCSRPTPHRPATTTNHSSGESTTRTRTTSRSTRR